MNESDVTICMDQRCRGAHLSLFMIMSLLPVTAERYEMGRRAETVWGSIAVP